MECKKIVRMLDRYIRKELDESTVQEVEAHLAACGACRRELDAQEALHQLLDFPLEIKAPPDFTLAIMAEIQKIHRKPRPNLVSYKGWGRSLVAAGILMLVINVAGVSKHIDYGQIIHKTSAVQENIVFSMDEVNRNISRVFNNIDIRIWRD
ncbi:anti-sigma factor family protein [Anaerosolibacter sp.]|uniref:anti-sigma factor family protein n=1 Tax=Anaerosolibacter sp. TaxID=1872527 RepID=UPI0039F03908